MEDSLKMYGKLRMKSPAVFHTESLMTVFHTESLMADLAAFRWRRSVVLGCCRCSLNRKLGRKCLLATLERLWRV